MRVWEATETRPFQCSILYLCYIFSFTMHSAPSVLPKHTSVRHLKSMSTSPRTPFLYSIKPHTISSMALSRCILFTPLCSLPSSSSSLRSVTVLHVPHFSSIHILILHSLKSSRSTKNDMFFLISFNFKFILVILDIHCFNSFLMLVCCKHS